VKQGQIAHLDKDPSNNALDNLAFLCLAHHDQYDSSTRQSKGLTIEEVKHYRTELLAFLSQSVPLSDTEILRSLMASLDRPAFRTPFQQESSLPRFQKAISETIETINTGRTPQGIQLSSKLQLRDPALRADVDRVVEALVSLRSAFDELLRKGSIQPCGCQDPDCPVFMLSEEAAQEMDSRRERLLTLAHALHPDTPRHFYNLELDDQ
jgi:hypothetical protein